MVHPDTRAAYLEAVFGDGAWEISKAEKKKSSWSNLSREDKVLAASNAASAGIGVAAINQMRRQATSQRTMPESERGGLPRQAARGVRNVTQPLRRSSNRVLRSVGRAGARPYLAGRKLGHNKVGAAVVGAGILGGTAFNATTDALSTKSILDKGKQKKVSKGVAQVALKPLTPERMDDIRNSVRARKGHITRRQNAVTKNDFTLSATVSKADEDKRQVFGWASITELNGEPVVDLQGDYVTIEEIEKAAHEYIAKSRKGGDMHRRNGDEPYHVSDLIESVVVTPEKKAALGIPDDSPTGWWVGFQIHDDETWKLVKEGKRPMFSIHGRGVREDMELPVAVGKALTPRLPRPQMPNTGVLKPKMPKPPVAPKPAQGAVQQRILRPLKPRRVA